MAQVLLLVMFPWGSPRWHDVRFRRCVCRRWPARWTSSQLVDCDTIDSTCYPLAPEQCVCVCEACHVHRGQLQLHRKQCSTSRCTFGLVPGSVTGYKAVTVNSNEALMAVFAQPPVSVAIEADGGFFQLFSGGVMQFWCGTNLDLDVLSVGCDTDGSTGCRIVSGALQ